MRSLFLWLQMINVRLLHVPEIGMICGEVCNDVIEGLAPFRTPPSGVSEAAATARIGGNMGATASSSAAPLPATSLQIVPYQEPARRSTEPVVGEYVTWSQMAPNSYYSLCLDSC